MCPARHGASSSTASSRMRAAGCATSREGAGRRGHGLPYRVDDQELHRDGDPEAARRRKAVARRSRRALRAGAEGSPLPDDRLAADHHPPSAIAFRGIPRRQPLGRSAALRNRAELSRMLRGGIPFSNAPGIAYEYSNYGFAILGGSCRRCPAAVRRLRDAEHSSAARHDVDHAASSEVPAERRAVGYRWEDERWKEEPALPHGSFGAMGGMLTSIRDLSRYVAALPRGVAAARRAGDAARSAGPRCARCSSPGAPPACASCSTSRRARRT